MGRNYSRLNNLTGGCQNTGHGAILDWLRQNLGSYQGIASAMPQPQPHQRRL